MSEPEFKIGFHHCARCGETHMGLPVYRFVGEPPLPHTHYTQCPVTMQPVLVSIQYRVDGEDVSAQEEE